MMEISTRSKWSFLGALVSMMAALLLVALAPAWADEENICREDCRADHSACFGDARDVLEECADACEKGDRGCRRDCIRDFRSSGPSCNIELFECRMDCRGDLNETCVDICTAELETCHQNRATCSDQCRVDAKAAVAACKTVPTEEKRSCMRDAKKEARICKRDCRAKNHCGRTAMECIDGCKITD